MSLTITYAVALALTTALLFVMPARGGIWTEARCLNWTSYLLASLIEGLEIGFLRVYRSAWNIGLAAFLVNVVASLLLVPVALLTFKQHKNRVNVAGILTCLVGLIMLNWKQ